MSNSVAKHNKIKCDPKISNKLARSKANRKLRRIAKQLLNTGEEFLPYLRDVSDVWSFPSDGLAIYWPNLTVKYKRK